MKEIKKLIFELLQYERISAEKTSSFKQMHHNKDLCPGFRNKFEEVFSALQKYRKVSRDTQGFRDNGTDILVKDGEAEDKYCICIQIKSEKCLNDKDYLKDLKAQYQDTLEFYGEENIVDYYIVLCCDATANINKIRAINGYWAKNKKVHIIEPEYSMMFLRLSLLQIDAVVKRKLGKDDIVIKEALGILQRLTPTEMAVLLYMLYERFYNDKYSLSVNELENSSFLNIIYRTVPDHKRDWFFTDEAEQEETEDTESETYVEIEDSHEEELYDPYIDDTDEQSLNRTFEARLTDDIYYLEDNFISAGELHNDYILDLEGLDALTILMLDGKIRYLYEGTELLMYMMEMFPVKGIHFEL